MAHGVLCAHVGPDASRRPPVATTLRLRKPRLAVFLLDDRPPLVITAFWANGVGRSRSTAIGAIADRALLDVVVRASFAGSAVGMFTFGDSHR
jgi:hypothetical protein